MYQNLAAGAKAAGAEESVHLCDYPYVDPALLDESLNHRMATAQRVVSLGHRLRETADQPRPPAARRAAVRRDDAAGRGRHRRAGRRHR